MAVPLLNAVKKWWRRQSVAQRGRMFGLAAVIVILLVPATLREFTGATLKPAEFYFVQPMSQYVAGQSFPLELRVRTHGTPINAIGFTLIFNPAYLEVESMTTDRSFCTLYTENNFSNDRGMVKLSCGTPRPGFQGDSLAVRLQLRARTAGSTAVLVDPASALILANDGKGSSIVKNVPKVTLNVQQL